MGGVSPKKGEEREREGDLSEKNHSPPYVPMHDDSLPSVYLIEASASTSSALSSNGCSSSRRRLPLTPSDVSPPSVYTLTPSLTTSHLFLNQSSMFPSSRRSSTPRLLPTPPPTSPDFRSPSCILERRPSGRMLPRPPPQFNEPPSETSSSSPLLESERGLTPDGDMPRIEESSPSVEPIGDYSIEDQLAEFESERPSHHLQSASSIGICIDQFNSKSYGGSECDEKDARSSSNSSSHGLNPSHYLPNAPLISPQPRSHSISSSHSAVAPSVHSNEGDRPTGLGLVHCTIQHFPVRKRLRVNILKIEALAGGLKPEMEMHAQMRVAIPGLKSGKEQSSEVKRGRDPVFNQEFFFDNVSTEDLDTKTLHLSAYHHGGKDILIGDSDVTMHDFPDLHMKKEVKLIEELKQNLPKASPPASKLGKISITSCIERDARRLTINIKKVDDLPKWGFLGAPDVCVKITLMGGSGPAKTKGSRILKSTTSAVFNEAVMFIFNPTKAELAATKITISVHDNQRSSTGEDVIGCAYLGIFSQDKSELEQWKNTVEHMGKEYKGCHHLKHPSTHPPREKVTHPVDDEPEEEEEREEGFEF